MEDVIVSLTMDDAESSIKETLIHQYRMHSDIMDIINDFYDKHLKDGNEDNYKYDTKAHYVFGGIIDGVIGFSLRKKSKYGL